MALQRIPILKKRMLTLAQENRGAVIVGPVVVATIGVVLVPTGSVVIKLMPPSKTGWAEVLRECWEPDSCGEQDLGIVFLTFVIT